MQLQEKAGHWHHLEQFHRALLRPMHRSTEETVSVVGDLLKCTSKNVEASVAVKTNFAMRSLERPVTQWA